jgi:hypothetical protein
LKRQSDASQAASDWHFWKEVTRAVVVVGPVRP